MIALIDADSIFFRVAYRPKSKLKLRREYDKFINGIKLAVTNELMEPFSEEELQVLIAVKGQGNFRKDLYPEYKKNRPDLDPEIRERLNYVYQHAVKQGAKPADNMEADDLVSIWAAEAREAGTKYVVCGIDKDLLQIEGHHYNYGKDTFTYMNKEEAYFKLMCQCLTGDTTDNIPGIKGIGIKTAEKLLKGKKGLWSKVKALWLEKKAGNPGLSYRLLKMLESFEEFEDVQKIIKDKACLRKRGVAT